MTKTNPRRVPATQADVKRAYQDGVTEGIERGLRLFLFTLIDKHDAPMENVRQLVEEINYTAESVSQGYIKWADIAHVLQEEYCVEIKLK